MAGPSVVGRSFLMASAVLAVIARWMLRVPPNANPPDVRVEIGADGWDLRLRGLLAEQGYAHVQGLLKREEVERLRKVAYDYCYGETRRALPLTYGGYSVPNFLDIPELADAAWVPKDPRVQKLLTGMFNGTDYRFASHNDVGCDFVGVWHKDILRGSVAKFQECDVWSPDPTGAEHEIYKVMFYLQDHVHDEQAMKVIPGSHVLRYTPWEKGYVAVHPRMGDVVIIDQRISHAGNTFYDVLGKGRLFVQVGFGRANRFTDEFERGTVERQQALQQRMLQLGPQPRGLATLVTDAKFTLLTAALSAVPPYLLNYVADQDIKDHAKKRCGQPATATATTGRGSEL